MELYSVEEMEILNSYKSHTKTSKPFFGVLLVLIALNILGLVFYKQWLSLTVVPFIALIEAVTK